MERLGFGQKIAFLANLGVIAGIALLAYEMRQNTVAIRSTASQGVQDQLSALYEMAVTDPMMEIYMKGMASYSELDPLERAKFNAYLSNVMSAMENLYVLVREGSFDEDRAQGWWLIMRSMLEYPGGKQHWEDRKFRWTDDFTSFVENDVMSLDAPSGTSILEALE
jgi:hypothetical protein